MECHSESEIIPLESPRLPTNYRGSLPQPLPLNYVTDLWSLEVNAKIFTNFLETKLNIVHTQKHPRTKIPLVVIAIITVAAR